ncbi:hypothetical protein PENTCL1PPCAC_3737, partial [Pristionchus entomophagus]
MMCHLGGVGVGSTLAARSGEGDVDEASVVLDTTMGTSGELLLLLLLLDLGGLGTDLSGTSERTVHLTSEKADVESEGGSLADGERVEGSGVVIEDGRSVGEDELLSSELGLDLTDGDLRGDLETGELAVNGVDEKLHDCR